MDACCYIDLVQQQNGHPLVTSRNDHIWYCRKFLDAAMGKDIEVYGSTLLVSECTAIRNRKNEKVLTDQVKSSFRAMLLSGKPVVPVQPTPKIIDRARDLSWVDGLGVASIDAIHIATAIIQNCDAFITTDQTLTDKVNGSKNRFLIKVAMADAFKDYLPDIYRQEPLEFKGKNHEQGNRNNSK